MNNKKTIGILCVFILILSSIAVYVYAGCSASPVFTKGNCEFGQICVGEECKWADRDLDGYPNYDFCRRFPDGSHNCDCDDYDSEVHPGAVERCNYKDDNCNGLIVNTNMNSCSSHSLWAYPYGYMAYLADCLLLDAVYAGHGCETGGGTYTDYGNYIQFVCPPAKGNQDNTWAWKCCAYNVTETGEGIDEGCEKTLHVCDNKPFLIDLPGEGEALSIGHCDGKAWCEDLAAGRDEGECEYRAQEEYIGVNEFNTYFCDKNNCYKFVKGTFQVCGHGWDCTAICIPGDCKYETKEWCNYNGIWQTEMWCQSECGEYDSACGGNCQEGACDISARKWCKEGYWIDENYCDCSVCGSLDSTCLETCGTCEEGVCDTANNMYCQEGVWGSDAYCIQCCREDYNCYVNEYCSLCEEGTCDTANNRYCFGGNTWLAEDYCGSCEFFDFDCGAELCKHNDCDTYLNKICLDGEWIDPGKKYCYQGYCGIDDPDDCPEVILCEENWECSEYSNACDGVYDTTVCLKWRDKNNCNTFFEYKGEEVLDCYFNFTCLYPNNDKDGDGYVYPTCYDEELGIVLGDPDWDCNDNNAATYPGGSETCNGIDDDCDDSIDEGCPCQPEEVANCGREEGICRSGIQRCIDGYWSVCGGSGYVGPRKETCDDALDNNCNSMVNENCFCKEGVTQECGSKEGICTSGTQACYNNEWGICMNATTGTDEICDNGLDDDCDGYVDGEDSNCEVVTPVITGVASCSNRRQDGDEEGLDCGGSCPESCGQKASACEYGKIETKCICGTVAYRTGYCCNGKYSLSQCQEGSKDSDNDGCNEDRELQLGTNPRNADTDGDGLFDCDTDEYYPLCYEDGFCDTERDYPETAQNCPTDCKERAAEGGLPLWLIIIIAILALAGIGGYLFVKSKGKKLSDFIKLKGKKKEEKPKFQLAFPKKVVSKPVEIPVKKEMPTAIEKPIAKRGIINLKAFVNLNLKKGYTKLQVKQAALKAGWPEEEVDKALRGKKSQYKLFK